MQGVQALLSCLVVQTILSGQCVTKSTKRRTIGKRSLSAGTIQILNGTMPCTAVDSNDSNYINTKNGTRLRRLALDDDHMMEVLKQKGGAFLPTYMSTNPKKPKTKFIENFRSRDKQKDPSFHPRSFNANDDNYDAKQVLLKFLSLHRYRHPSRSSRSPLSKVAQDVLADDRLDTLRAKRTSDDSTAGNGNTVVGFCQGRGAQSGDFVHMCTVCAATTTLPENRFPRVINEEICDASDRSCLYAGSIAHGACKQRIFNVNLLRKKEGACARAVIGGQEVLVDEWELYTHPLRVGCECMIHKASMFASLGNTLGRKR